MSRIKRHDTQPTVLLRKALYAAGHRYRKERYIKEARTHPDIVFPSKKLVVYVDGCFWHGCPLCSKRPESNATYWGPKIERNIARDSRQRRILEEHGWIVLRSWEHEVNEELERVVHEIEEVLDCA